MSLLPLPIDTQIAGKKTVQDWINYKPALTTPEAFEQAYKDFFLMRLQDRYLTPIECIKDNGMYRGEGFSIMAILCSLIEFLESSYQGKRYRHLFKNDILSPNEYSSSSDMFQSFLVKRQPFSNHFDTMLAKEFYVHVRCGLLHEARTKGKWVIWAKSPNNEIIKQESGIIKVYRDDFRDGIDLYLKNYLFELKTSPERQQAFIFKLDSLCEE